MAYKNLEENLVPKGYFNQGGLWLWGSGGDGNLGTNSRNNTSSPVQTVDAGTNWKQVSCGEFAGKVTAAIKTDGTLWLWGYNAYGTLGDGTTSPKSSPIQTVSGGTNWRQVSSSGIFTAAIKTDGTLWLWGKNQLGQLGDNTITHKSSPVQTVAGGTNWKQVSSNFETSGAIKTDGTLWLWGSNAWGAIGDNSRTSRSSPVQTVAGGTNWKQVACAGYFTAAIKTDGTLWLWGYNSKGQLGDNTITHKSSPVQTVAGGTNWKQVSCGGENSIELQTSAAIKTDGTLWTWGDNFSGQLGDGTFSSKSSPIQTVSGGTNWKIVDVSARNIGAIKTDGTLWLWGQGGAGAIGNLTTDRTSPVQTVAGGTNWKQVALSGSYSAAINETWGTIT